MRDLLNREIDYLRVSVTDRCNLRCVYCMPEQGVEPVAHQDVLSFEELLRICRAAAKLGFHKIKLTGGEPLVRLGIADLIRDMKKISGIDQVTMTTNGILLGSLANDLADAGLDAVNISLDTLDPIQFQRITRRSGLEKVLASIDRALEAGLHVKLNCVPTRTYAQIIPLVELARNRPIDVRFIELMPIGEGDAADGIPSDEILSLLTEAFGPLSPYDGVLGNGPAAYYAIKGFQGKVGLISAISHRFCADCNRVRLTATGFLKLCLHYDSGVDLRELLRGGSDDTVLLQTIQDAVSHKPARHHFEDHEVGHAEQHRMVQIGG